MVHKPLDQSECRILKLEYLTNKLRYEAEFLDVTRGPNKQKKSKKNQLIASSGCGQTCLNLPKLITKNGSVLCQE